MTEFGGQDLEGGHGFGGQSMVDPLRRVLVKRPDESFAVADAAEWGYVARPSLERARREHDYLVAILRRNQIEVIYHDEPQPGRADAVFVCDPVLITNAGAVVLKMAKPSRGGEEQALEKRLVALGIPVLFRLEGNARAEGGDLLWLDSTTLAVGQGFRTNATGFHQLREGLAKIGVRVFPVSLPYWHGPSTCLHLLSLISLVDHDLAVVHSPLLPVAFWQHLRSRGINLVEAPEEELPTLAPNVLAMGPRNVVMLAGNPITQRRLQEAGCQVWLYEGKDVSWKAEGGPTCLTRPILRQRPA